MKIKVALLVTIIILVISGCSQKKPKPNGNGSDANGIAADTVSIDESGINGRNGYNGSSDGMKSIYFDFGKYNLSYEMQDTVRFDTGVLRQKLKGGKVKLEGNCDEFGTDEYNYALGLKRAKAVKDSLQAQGVNGGQIVLVSFGESNPQCYEATDSCYARNRRVDLHLMR